MSDSVLPLIQELKSHIAEDIVGQEELLEKMLIAILANGHVLLESLPGLAKTRAVKSLSRNIQTSFKRIQFTPDLAPRTIMGEEIYHKDEDGVGAYKFQEGAVFANLVLADEINRAQPRVQNALLEAMEERQVTVAGVSHPLPDLFMVVGTQNPASQQGTYPLPEAQKDRFLMHMTVHYPSEEAEGDIIRLVRKEESQAEKAKGKPAAKNSAVDKELIFKARGEVDTIPVSREIDQYIVDMVFATRYPQKYSYQLKSCIQTGISPRGSLALDKCARAHAWLHGCKEVTEDNVRAVVHDVFRHRLEITDLAADDNVHADDVTDEIIKELSRR